MCAEQGVGDSLCGLNYSASLHYNDDDHPYQPYSGFPGGDTVGCVWGLQNLPLGSSEEYVPCGREAGDGVHTHSSTEGSSSSSAVTMVMQTPIAEPRFVGDAPLEDGGGGDGSWGVHPDVVEHLRQVTDNIGIPVGAPRSAARAAWALRTGAAVERGPWPVRQWVLEGGGDELPVGAVDVIGGLVCAGEAWSVDGWWRDSGVYLVRVYWGSLIGLEVDAMAAAVEKWDGPAGG
jgi:hypothetical protein